MKIDKLFLAAIMVMARHIRNESQHPLQFPSHLILELGTPPGHPPPPSTHSLLFNEPPQSVMEIDGINFYRHANTTALFPVISIPSFPP
jgi:hypothetical protein